MIRTTPLRRMSLHFSQIRRYEDGLSQLTLDAIRKLAIALRVNADTLLLASDERGPGDDLKLQFKAAKRRFAAADSEASTR